MLEKFGVKIYRTMLEGFDSSLFDVACKKLVLSQTEEAGYALAQALEEKKSLEPVQKKTISDSLVKLGLKALPALHDAVKSDCPDPYIVHALCEIASGQSEDVLISLMAKTDSADIYAALETIESVKALPLIETKAFDKTSHLRINALKAAGSIGSRDSFFAQMLDDEDESVRRTCAEILVSRGYDFPEEESIKKEIALLDFDSLIGKGDHGTRFLGDMLSSSNPQMQIKILDALSRINSAEAARHIERAASDKNAEIRAYAAEKYSRTENFDRNVIINLLNDSDAHVRSIAENLIRNEAEIFLPALALSLETAVNSGVSLFHLTSIQNLFVKIGSASVRVLEPLSYGNGTLAEAVAEILNDIGDDASVKILEGLTSSSNTTIQSIAIESMGERRDPSLFDSIVPMIKSDSQAVRKSAYDAVVMSNIARAEELFKKITSDEKLPYEDKLYIKNILNEIARVN